MSSSLKKCRLILLVLRGLPVQKENKMNYSFEEMNEDIQGYELPNAFLQRILLHICIPVAQKLIFELVQRKQEDFSVSLKL